MMQCLRMAKSRRAPHVSFCFSQSDYNWLFFPRYVQKILIGYFNKSRVVTVLTVTSLCATSLTSAKTRSPRLQFLFHSFQPKTNDENYISLCCNTNHKPAKTVETDLAAFANCIAQIALAAISTCETQDPFKNIPSSSRLVYLLRFISEQDSDSKTAKVIL